MGKVISKPIEIEIPTGRDIVLVVEGKPVVYIRHDETRDARGHNGESYVRHDYVACGIARVDKEAWIHEYVGSCANTMCLEVAELTIDGVVDAINDRYYTKKG